MKKRGFLQISFGWLFAIIAGAVILLLAIIISTNVIGIGQRDISASTQREIGILLNPLQTGFETARVAQISMPAETRIFNQCSQWGTFGRQYIGISQKSFGEWPNTPPEETRADFRNKYIFSKEVVEGRDFFIFSKPFEFPFPVADLIYITSIQDNYCFIRSPSDIEEELSQLDKENIFFTSNMDECSDESFFVCFGVSGSNEKFRCDVIVEFNSSFGDGGGSVEKQGKIVYFNDNALLYAAIFSDIRIYECQLKRLMQRNNELLEIYIRKTNLASKNNCPNEILKELNDLKEGVFIFKNSTEIDGLVDLVKDLDMKNRLSTCRLW